MRSGKAAVWRRLNPSHEIALVAGVLACGAVARDFRVVSRIPGPGAPPAPAVAALGGGFWARRWLGRSCPGSPGFALLLADRPRACRRAVPGLASRCGPLGVPLGDGGARVAGNRQDAATITC